MLLGTFLESLAKLSMVFFFGKTHESLALRMAHDLLQFRRIASVAGDELDWKLKLQLSNKIFQLISIFLKG